MYCLYNGEYGEHDLSDIDSLEAIIRLQEQSYAKKIGTIVGDYACEKIEYDWGRRDQRWTCRCQTCGTVIYQYHTKDWARCHGRTVKCSVCEERKRSEKKEKYLACVEARKKEREEARQRKQEEKRIRAERRVDYSDKKWIGVRNGHAVTIGKNGDKFVLRCDCGREFEQRPYPIFVRKSVVDCRGENCPYYINRMLHDDKASAGYDYEDECENALCDKGYEVQHKGQTGDFGVDLIAEKDGMEIAIQCKTWDAPAGVDAVQEVYAGGRYYGMEHFAVISRTGYTAMAIDMASVLGVYLCDDVNKFDYKDDINENARNMLPILKEAERRRNKLYELNGEKKTMAEWCREYGVLSSLVYNRMNKGYTFKEAIRPDFHGRKRSGKKYTVNGFTGNISEIGERFGVIPQTIRYRMKYRNMTIEEAVLQKNSEKQKASPAPPRPQFFQTGATYVKIE